MSWKEFWDKKSRNGGTDFHRQVGRTVGGEPISEEVFNILIKDLLERLQLRSYDIVLDLCCGNGMITSKIAKECEFVVAIDFSEHLINVAKKNYSANNIEYMVFDALDLNWLGYPNYFSKVLFFDALHYFEKYQLLSILRSLKNKITNDGIIFIDNIPDMDKKWSGEQDFIWWKREDIKEVCERLDLDVEFIEQKSYLLTSNYRFDVKICLK